MGGEELQLRGVELRAVEREQRLSRLHRLPWTVSEQALDPAADSQVHLVEPGLIVGDARDGVDVEPQRPHLNAAGLHANLLPPPFVDDEYARVDLVLGHRCQRHVADGTGAGRL